MKFSQWRAALEVLNQNLNVSESAKRLFVSQSVISKQIRALEAELGVQIFERSGKRFVGTTRAGEKLLNMANQMMKDAHNIERAAREFSGDSGAIRLAATHSSLNSFLPAIFKTFKEKHAQTELLVQEGTSLEIAQQVASAEVDLGVLLSLYFNHPHLVALPFLEIPFVLIAHPNFPKLELLNPMPFQLENLNYFPLILPHITLDFREKIEKVFHYYHLKPKIIMDSLNTNTMKTWVLNQFGLAILPENSLNENEKEQFKIFNIASFFPKIQARLLIRKGSFLRRAEYNFIQLFAPHFNIHFVDAALHGNHQDCFL